jgi:cytochrome P450
MLERVPEKKKKLQMNQIDQSRPQGQCPFSSGAPPSMTYRDDMFAGIAEARRVQPVFFSPETGYWIVTRYADVVSIFMDSKRFSARNAAVPVSPVHPDARAILDAGGFSPEPTISNIDAPQHTRLRNAFSPQLNPGVARKLEDSIRRIVEADLAKLKGRQRIDLLADFAYELPARVMFLLLGIPDEEVPLVKELAVGRFQIDFAPSTREQQVVAAGNLLGLWQYTVELVQKRVRDPGDDFISGLLALRNGDDSVLTINEINTIAYGVVFAGHETTTNQMTNTIREMLLARENWEALCADPSLVANAVEEGLRFCGSVIGWRRVALEDVEIGGAVIPEGAPVLLSLAGANRDPEVFEDPERFDVRRKNARRHMTLGAGIHFCLGAPVTRLEMKIALEMLVQRFPNLRLVPGETVEHYETFIMRAPDKLIVDLNG